MSLTTWRSFSLLTGAVALVTLVFTLCTPAQAIQPAAWSSQTIFPASGALTGIAQPITQQRAPITDQTSSAITTATNPTVAAIGAFNIVINPGPNLTVNGPALAAFNRAAEQWESFIADPITVTIDAEVAPIGSPTTLGATSSVTLAANYDDIRNQMVLDAANELDDAVVAALPTSANATFLIPTGFGLNGNLSGTKANLKALGFGGLDAVFGVSDGDITFNSNFSFDFDNSDGVGFGLFDFESIAAHEIGHALGFISLVDFVDEAINANQTSQNLEPTTLDLFRFADNTIDDPDTLVEFTTDARSLIPGSADITEQIIPGFGDVEIPMSTGVFNGDGNQASHFQDNMMLGIFDPTLAPGEISPIRANDLRALDLIGYEIASPAIPEPATLVLLLAGIAGISVRRW